MGAGHSFGVEPPVISVGNLESKFVILEIIFSNINIKAITGTIMEWFTFGFLFFLTAHFPADIAIGFQLVPDLGKVVFGFCNGKRSLNGL